MSTTTEPLPDYTATVTECGDPQPVIDEMTEWLDEQTAPEILALLDEQSNDDEPAPTEPEFVEPAEDETDNSAEDETDETSGAEDD